MKRRTLAMVYLVWDDATQDPPEDWSWGAGCENEIELVRFPGPKESEREGIPNYYRKHALAGTNAGD